MKPRAFGTLMNNESFRMLFGTPSPPSTIILFMIHYSFFIIHYLYFSSPRLHSFLFPRRPSMQDFPFRVSNG